jgi:RNA recognition motif-containing protein
LSEQFARSSNDTNLFIKSLKGDVTEELLKTIFSKFGIITSVGVRAGGDKLPKAFVEQNLQMKFGFINFANSAEAKKAFTDAKKDSDVRELIHPDHDLRKEFLFFAQPKAVREQYLKMQRKNMVSTMMLQQQMMMMQIMMEQNMKSKLNYFFKF